ncbi:MAG: helix-turn-helix domain-containing protein [Thermodesulfobacteriota bacterium]|jgi:excisionase family DNA binding protein
MRTEFEEKDIEAIARRVSEIIKPMLTHPAGSNEKDTIFDVKGLAEYFRVKESWVYQRVHTNSIPYFKVGKYPRFRKREIDRWTESKAVRPIPVLKVIKARGVSHD